MARRRTSVVFPNERSVTRSRGIGVRTGKPTSVAAQTYEQLLARQAGPLPGQVRIYSQDPQLMIQTDMGDTPWLLSDGFGGWDLVDRPRRVQSTRWKGRKTFKLTGDIIFDRWSEDGSVEPEISVLEAMALPVAAAPAEPPTLTIDGGGVVPHDYHSAPSAFWVLDDIQVKEQRFNPAWQRSLYQATLIFYQYGEISVLPLGTIPRPATPKTYKIKRGDTLITIAQKVLHDKNKWHQLGTLNGIRDPKAVKVGQTIKLP